MAAPVELRMTFTVFSTRHTITVFRRERGISIRQNSLLKKAGQEDLTVQLVTGPIASGAVEQSEVFAQQATAAGVTVKLQDVTTTQLYGPNYLRWAFSMDTWSYDPFYVQARFSSVSPGILDECHFHTPRYNSLFLQAMSTTNVALQTQIAHELQEIEWNTGGYIIPINYPLFDAVNNRVMGAEPSEVGTSFNFFQQFKTMWFR